MEIFRTFEHQGKTLQLAVDETVLSSKPQAKTTSRLAPGSGIIEIQSLALSAEKIAAGEKLTLSAQISGNKIAYLFTEILFHDPELNQYYGPILREYIACEQNREVNGMSHPVWGPEIALSLTLTPRLQILTDGAASALACLLPAGYGSSNQHLDGLHTAANGTSQRARLTFDSSGALQGALVCKGRGTQTTPRALTLRRGDQFCPYVQVLTQAAEGEATWQATKALSTPLTYGEPFRLVAETPIPGEYLAGVLAQDLDGKFTRQYASFRQL